jgi:gamma-glutamyltranspeptidase/glutathione hydrolase
VRGAVASGHPLTTEAACEILMRGGNAFDAILAAAFASFVTEPTLTSLGGGGFLIVHRAESGEDVLYDFFVNAPGKGSPSGEKPALHPVGIQFKSTVQVFHTGMGSVGVPGVLKGLILCYEELASMDLEDILRPALRYLEEGVEVNELQQYLLHLLMPILISTPYGKEIFEGKDQGGRLFNPLFREFLSLRSPHAWLDMFYGEGAEAFSEEVGKEGGLLTARDLREYAVQKREPLATRYLGYEILTNPLPSLGGGLLMRALGVMGGRHVRPSDEELLVEAMDAMNRARQGVSGTTHISVMDGKGNAAGLSSSNGSNCGCFFGNTGIMLNNMMGEDDLFPGGFFTVSPGERVGSMMSPTLIKEEGRPYAVLGSGGSKRIKTAMLQVIYNLLKRRVSVREAVEAPRIHLDDEGVVQAEPGFQEDSLKPLRAKYRVNHWNAKDLYFGGVHAVMGSLEGWGDSRRGGCFQALS